MLPQYEKYLLEAEKNKSSIRQFVTRQRKKKPNGFDAQIHAANDEAFSQIDCLHCANCCKTTSPLLTNVDIDRLAKGLRLKPSQVVQQFTKIDEDGDTVMNATPCPFLLSDNACSVYEFRPIACRDYPHLRRKNMISYLPLAEKNAAICPAVAVVFSHLIQRNQ
jgi:Fe-S-cluster containining protein